jgi:hypothetical protein
VFADAHSGSEQGRGKNHAADEKGHQLRGHDTSLAASAVRCIGSLFCGLFRKPRGLADGAQSFATRRPLSGPQPHRQSLADLDAQRESLQAFLCASRRTMPKQETSMHRQPYDKLNIVVFRRGGGAIRMRPRRGERGSGS